MQNLIKAIVFIFIIIILPMLADIISNFIEGDTIIKCVYFISGLILIHFWKESR